MRRVLLDEIRQTATRRRSETELYRSMALRVPPVGAALLAKVSRDQRKK